jgi:hypothetical protein
MDGPDGLMLRNALPNKGGGGPVNAESPPVGGLSAIRRSGGFRGKGTFR